MDTQKRTTIWISAILVLGVVAVAAWQAAAGSPSTKTTYSDTGILSEPISLNDWTKGSKTPKVTLVEYSDFQCPACGYYFPMVEKITAEYKDVLAFTYRHFPLAQHKNALVAAYAAEAAGKQGKFWEMYQKLFETQADWSDSTNAPGIFEGYAQSFKLDMTRFKSDTSSQATKDAVIHDRDTGLATGVNSTPSFYLNGKKMQNPKSYEEFKALIDYAIAHK